MGRTVVAFVGALAVGIGEMGATGVVPPIFPHNISFGPPVPLGSLSKDGHPTLTVNFDGSGKFGVVLTDRTLVSSNGGRSFCSDVPTNLRSNVVVGTAPSPGGIPAVLHDFGNASAHMDPGPAGTSMITSTYANFFTFDPSTGKLVSSTRPAAISFAGLPRPARCDAKYSTCPLRLQGSGTARFGDGTLLQSAIVYFGGPGDAVATSIICFKSRDGGYSWHYTGTIADADDYPWSQEGPNEHDLAVLDFGIILAVVRTGANGPPYHDFGYSYSEDGGASWTPLVTMRGTGSARPRLAMLGSGYAPLLMSGGRSAQGNVNDLKVWVEWTGFGAAYPPAAPYWDGHSLSYWHNRLASDGTPKFTENANRTGAARETTAYTSLVQVGLCSAVVLYDLIDAEGDHHGFSMRLDLHMDKGGETGIHC